MRKAPNTAAWAFLLFSAAGVSLVCPGAAQAQPVSPLDEPILELTATDSETHQPVAARVRLRDASGRDHVPVGSVEVPIGPDRWFVMDGRVRLPVPRGQTILRVERGTEYDPVYETINIGSEPVHLHKVTLRRWINMRKLGYLCGEDHLHVPAEQLGPMVAAEGLDVGSSFSWWNGPQFKVPADANNTVSFNGRAFPATLFDAEVEDVWGALYLIGLKRPVSLAADPRRSHLTFVKEAREQGALICYQGGWSREVLLDALLGNVDVVNVCNNNFHRHKYQPRPEYSNLLNVTGFPMYASTPEGMMQMNTDTYYRLLNCGLRLAAGAGSATGAKTTPAGYNRSYVRRKNAKRPADFLEAWRKGRNFVTDGPMIFLTVDSALPGDVLALSGDGGRLRAKVRAICNQPLRSLEIIVNGTVTAKANLRPQDREAVVECAVTIRQGSWIAARATAEDRLLSDEELASYVKSEGKRQSPSRLLFGQTSPVYVTVDGRGPAVPASLHEASRMLDAFEQFALKTASEPYRDEIAKALRVARERLEAAGN